MKIEHKIIVLSVILGLVAWVIDAFLDSLYFYEGSFLDLLILELSTFELYLRLTWIVFFLAFGIIASRIVRKRMEAEEALHRAYDELEKRVQDRTAELKNANQALGIEITDHKQAEEALKESEQRYATTLASIGDAIIATDTKGRITFMNAVAEELTGWTLTEVATKPVKEVFNIINEYTHAEVKDPVTRVLQEGMIIGLANHTLLIRKDGMEIPIDDSGAPIKSQEGKITGVVLVFRDITERKRIEEELRRSIRQLNAILTNIPDIAWLKDKESRFIAVNKPFADTAGVRPEDLVGKTDFDIWPKELAESYGTDDREVMATGKRKQVVEPLVDKEGKKTWIETIKTPIYDDRGVVIGTTGIARDVTERVRAEEELKKRTEELARSNADLEQFAYVASHDLQEPLRMVSGFTQLLERRYKGKLDKDADEFIAYIVDGARRMQNMIEDLLAYSRIGTRGKPFEPVNLEDVFNQAVTNLKVAIEENKAEVTHDPLPTVTADASQMIQLFQNLISNAIKFRKKEELPHIHISARRGKYEWVFSVQDNGIGISPEFKDRLFLLFQREHAAGEYPGTGIGLAVCRRIMERHGGRIWAESEPGKGSVFYFTIPIRSE